MSDAGGEIATSPKASITVDGDMETVDLWLKLPGQLKTAGGFGHITTLATEALRFMEKDYRVQESTSEETDGPTFELRKGMGGGMTFTLWQEGDMLRMQAKVITRLHMIFGVFALGVGGIAYLIASFGFFGLAPHYALLRHAGKFGFIAGLVVAFTVWLVGWIPVQRATRSARAKSLDDAKALIDDLAHALDGAVAQLESSAAPAASS